MFYAIVVVESYLLGKIFIQLIRRLVFVVTVFKQSLCVNAKLKAKIVSNFMFEFFYIVITYFVRKIISVLAICV